MAGPQTYRKRPIEVAGLLFTGYNHAEVRQFVGNANWIEPSSQGDDRTAAVWNISQNTWNDVNPGDTILRGAVGECYPCSPDALEATYEQANGVNDPARTRALRLGDPVRVHLRDATGTAR